MFFLSPPLQGNAMGDGGVVGLLALAADSLRHWAAPSSDIVLRMFTAYQCHVSFKTVAIMCLMFFWKHLHMEQSLHCQQFRDLLRVLHQFLAPPSNHGSSPTCPGQDRPIGRPLVTDRARCLGDLVLELQRAQRDQRGGAGRRLGGRLLVGAPQTDAFGTAETWRRALN